jgi:hypothetical protein
MPVHHMLIRGKHVPQFYTLYYLFINSVRGALHVRNAEDAFPVRSGARICPQLLLVRSSLKEFCFHLRTRPPSVPLDTDGRALAHGS